MSDSTLTATQLAVELGNAPEAPETIYLSDEAEVNKLTLSVSASAAVTYSQAKPVLRSEASKASGSLLYLDLRNLQLTPANLEAIKVSVTGWASLIDPAGYICLAPEETIAQPAEGALEVKLDEVKITKALAGGNVQLYLVLFRVPPVTTGNTGLPWAFKSLLAEPPTGEADLHEMISLSLSNNVVVSAKGDYAGYKNGFTFTFAPGDKGRTVKAGEKTQFNVTFVYASEEDPEGYGALCTAKQAMATKIKPGQNAQGWRLTEPHEEKNPTWTLRPPKDKPIVPAQSTVTFSLSELETQLRAGPTLMFVSYSGVPGYEDGAYTRVLRKVEHAEIDTFEISPDPVVLKEGSAKVTLKWKTANAEAVSISGVGAVEELEEGEETVEIIETTPFTLTAEGPPNARNSAIETVTARVLPVINSFEADPEAISAEDFPCNVRLSWNVASKGKVRFVSSTSGKDPHEYEPVGTVGVEIKQPQEITLVPDGGDSDPLVRRSVILSAFSPELSKPALQWAPSCVAASPTGAFVVVGSSSQSGAVALDTMTYHPIGQPIQTAQGANDLAFSGDGTMLYIAGAAKVVSPIKVTATGTETQYEFTNLGNLALTAEPRRIAVAPSGRYVYVTTAADELVVLEAGSGGTLTLLTTLTVGSEPEGVAVLPTGSRVYVANAGSNTVTVVGVGSTGRHEVVTTIEKLPSEPAGVAATADGKVLLIACRGAGKVEARSVEFPSAIGKAFTAGAGACDIAIVPGGRYAAVADKGANSLTLLGLGETPGTCSVVGGGIQTGAGPVSVSVTPEAGLLLAATGGEKALSVITLSQYAETGKPVEAGGWVTDVVVRPDGKEAVVWHDARRKFSRGEPSTGVFVYEIDSLEMTPRLGKQGVIDFVYLPTAGANRAYAITQGNSVIEIIDTTTWTPAGEFKLESLTKGTPRALSASADGSRLFALAGDANNRFDLVALEVGEGGALTAIGKALRVFAPGRNTVAEVAAAPDGSRAYVLDAADQQVVFVAEKGGEYALDGEPVKTGPSILGFALSPDGSRIFVLGRPGMSNTLTSIVTATRAATSLTLSNNQFSALNAVVVSPDNSKVLATDGVMVGVRIFDASSLRLIQTISFEGEVENPMGVAVTPTGSRFFTANVNSNNLSVAQQVQPVGAPGEG